MKQFENIPKNNRPLVLGLSATLLNGNLKSNNNLMSQVEKYVSDLETTFLGKVAACEELSEVLQ